MQEYSESSHEKIASAKIYTGRCQITGVQLITDGTFDAKLQIIDNTAEGDEIDPTEKVFEMTLEGGASVHAKRQSFVFPISCLTGIYCKLEGKNASYIVEFHP